MDLVNILRTLSRRRRLLILAGVVAIVLGLTIAFRFSLAPPKLESRKHEEGTAVVRMLVDTPRSQVVDVNPQGSEYLGARANVLANVLVEGQIKTAIARNAGVPPRRLFAAAESATEPELTATSAEKHSHVLVTRVLNSDAGDQLPIIEIEAEAPRTKTAAALANGAVESLRSHLESKATAEAVPEARRLFVVPLGAAQTSKVVRGAGPIVGFGAAVLIFGFFCGAILIASALANSWRAAAASEFGVVEPAPEPGLDPSPPRSSRVRGVPQPDEDPDLKLLRRDSAS
jgi:capsular polysaccharide biosynthesis protein